MTDRPYRATRNGPLGFGAWVVFFLVLAFVGNELTDDVVLPGVWGVVALAGYVVAVFVGSRLVAYVLCDALDRLRGRVGAG